MKTGLLIRSILRWFCRLGLEGSVPDHSTFSKNRHARFRGSDFFRRVFEDVVRACMVTETAKSDDDGDDAPPGIPPSEPKFTSLTDPAAAWTNKGQMKALFAYGTNYLIDTKEAVIVDVEPLRAGAQRSRRPRRC